MVHMRGLKGRLPWLSAAVVAIAASFIATQPAAAAAEEPGCNGAAELCAKPFDEVVLPGTHNSMSALELGWGIPNQFFSIPSQLRAGIRGFLIDTHYGKRGPNGTVENVKFEDRADSDGMYLCHELCLLGASELIPELSKVRDYLAANPNEVILFINQAGVTPEDFADAVTDSGLDDYLYTGSTPEWPTLGEMIEGNQRVVMFSEGNTGTVPWYHDAYGGAMQETPYNFRKNGDTSIQQAIDRLTKPENLNESCAPNRGGTDGSLFLMNHWVNGTLDNSNPVAPDPEVAKILNAKDVLVNRARACQQRRGILPTLIAVDDFGAGDLLGAVRELNGLPPLPDPDPDEVPEARLVVKVQKRVVTRAGRKAAVRVKLRNVGNGPANVKVCATVPKRLAKKTRCAFARVAAGGSASPVIRIQTKRHAKGAGKVKFTVSTAVEKLTAKTTLKVKPNKKLKRKKRDRR
jgi:hypothetical protein